MLLGTFRSPDGELIVGELADDRVRVLAAPTMLTWLAGEGRARTGVELEVASLAALSPVPDPPSVRDFYAFERHAAAGARLRGRELAPFWYEEPAFYFSNPASILGPGEPVTRPQRCEQLDFELEIAAVVGIGRAPGDGLGIAGFTLMNDWSARDVQAEEVTVGLGPHKSKDFGTSLGPFLVTPEELALEDGRLALTARVLVNDEEVARGDASEQHFSWDRMLAHAARGTRLRPGDVLGSGTLSGGCLLELGPLAGDEGEPGRWIEPGDVVTLAAERLGALQTPVEGSAAG